MMLNLREGVQVSLGRRDISCSVLGISAQPAARHRVLLWGFFGRELSELPSCCQPVLFRGGKTGSV